MTLAPQTYDLTLLDRSSAKWNSSSSLRAVYADIFDEMRRGLVPGSVLEIGSGIGMARDYFPGLVTSDVVATRFVDRAVSAYAVPCEGWNNIIAIDMLHHLETPLDFLKSAAAALAPGGRLVLAEPAGTWGGRIFYKLFHHEPCEPAEVHPPFQFAASADGAFANMGIAHALFGRERAAVMTDLEKHGLTLARISYRDLMAYPATGGFSHSALLPPTALRGMLVIERCLPQWVLRFLALRMIIVLQKDAAI